MLINKRGKKRRMTIIDEEIRTRMEEYTESTAEWLDHYFGNKVGFVRNYLLCGEVQDAVKSLEERDQEFLPVSFRREFINGLTAKIEEKIPILRNV